MPPHKAIGFAMALALLTGPALMASDSGEHRPVYSPDGSHIVFMSRSERTAGDWELFRMAADGQHLTRLTHHPGWDGYAVWSPDGRRLVFDREDPATGTKSPWALEMKTGKAKPLGNHSGWMSVCDWSRDGKTLLAFHEVDKQRDLYLLDPKGAILRRLTETKGQNEHDAHFSPDGTRIALANQSDEGQGSTLELLDVATGSRRVLRSSKGRIYGLAFSPDGRSLAYTDDDPGGEDDDAEIFVLELPAGKVRQLTDNKDWDHMPVWRPDGRALLFSSYRTGTERLYSLDPVSGAVSRIWAGEAE